jgi:ABC-type antimicrobial peptide transport system permease subunit
MAETNALQFLVEAMVLSLSGGAIGIALGFALSYAVANVMQWSAVVTPQAVMMSFGVAAGIGIFLGFYPARKAASLNPIDALRYETRRMRDRGSRARWWPAPGRRRCDAAG